MGLDYAAMRAEVEDLREQIAADIESLVDYESADLPPGGTWISRTKVLALVRGGSPTPGPSGPKAAKAHGSAVPECDQGSAQ